mmetsp:Transcript_32254/g.63530  ORF Transcript_32254/g.63530 Transcript_32254/m.63530 type:complete len:99 (-) Transcript_32254:194-490(-)
MLPQRKALALSNEPFSCWNNNTVHEAQTSKWVFSSGADSITSSSLFCCIQGLKTDWMPMPSSHCHQATDESHYKKHRQQCRRHARRPMVQVLQQGPLC